MFQLSDVDCPNVAPISRTGLVACQEHCTATCQRYHDKLIDPDVRTYLAAKGSDFILRMTISDHIYITRIVPDRRGCSGQCALHT